jgi:signal transduction histidine kinase/ligand-binding sensor domain-containing protein/DNA-binding response OmpR family regulator
MVVDVPKRLLVLYGLAGFLLQCIPASTTAQPPVLQFEHLTTKDGLSDNHVWAIHQDRYGFMWFGTEGGLNRYDGRVVKVYDSRSDDSTSLDFRWVKAICEDTDGNLWVACRGLNKYNRETDNFTQYTPGPGRIVINTLLYDSAKALWVGTSNGLFRFDIATEKFEPINLGTRNRDFAVYSIADDHKGNLWLATNIVARLVRFNKLTHEARGLLRAWGVGQSVHVDNDAIWVGTSNGLVKYDATQDTSVLLNREKTGGKASLSEWVHALTIDSSGRFWVGTRGYGLNLFDKTARRFVPIDFSASTPANVSSPWILSLHVDRSGNLWAGTSEGVNKAARWSKQFRYYTHNPFDSNSVLPGEVRSVIEDSERNLWLVTQSGGLCRLDQRRSGFRNYSHIFENEGGVRVVYQDRQGTFWAGNLNGLMTWDPKKKKVIAHVLKRNVQTLLEDSRGVFWVGTNSGVCRYDRSSGTAIWYEENTRVWKVHEDESGKIWASGSDSTGYVFYSYDRERDRFDRLLQKSSVRIGRRVNCVHRDSDGRLWLGMGTGFGTYSPERDSLGLVSEEVGSDVSTVFGLAEDGRGKFWMSTNRGIAEYSPGTRKFRIYGFPGLTLDALLAVNVQRTTQGEFVFGLGEGFVIFHPDSIRDNPIVPPIVITDFQLFDEPVRIGSDSPLKKNILTTERIDLAYDQNTLTFEFAALDFTSPSENQYAYKLEGFDNDWVDAGTRNSAHYTNVPPGEYVFRVRGSNNDGVWNEEGTSVAVVITPPWWKTTWAYLGYGLFILSGLYGIRRYEMNRLNLRNQLKLDEVRLKEREEADRVKSRFFANISHEFRTPLTLILGPIQKWKIRGSPDIYVGDERKQTHTPGEGFEPLIARSAGELSQDMALMERNANRLLRLINQLLDLSKLESGAMKLRASRGNIVSFVKGIASSFESSAGMRGIKVTTETDADEIEAYFDRDKLEKILTNLLSNAFKFTPDGGSVTVRCHSERSEESAIQKRDSSVAACPPSLSNWGRRALPQNDRYSRGFVSITISDTGIGIPAEELPRVFDRFYQVDQSQTREYEGSGIGLALTKELVELHHGTISVRSEVGKGTEFTVRLPLGREHLKDDEVITTEETELQVIPTSPVGAIRESPLREQSEESQQVTSLPIVLIIEDNADVRAYMKEYLVRSYQVIEAHDGAEGIEKAIETIPDLIISDVMMPKKDGFEVCKTLKLDEKTSHIPIILLTAKAGTENKIEGLETGADDYLTKPFDAKELLARVKNLIELRRKLRERFSVGQVLKPGEIAVSSMEDAFLQRVKSSVEAHLGDEDFSVEELGKDVGMSRSQIHRKLTALTNLAPSDFIRYLRLHRAMDLLRQNAGTVAEIAFSVGFGSVAYFTKCFREQFGTLPSEIRKAATR